MKSVDAFPDRPELVTVAVPALAFPGTFAIWEK